MSVSEEHLNEIMEKPAVLCCRTEEGTIIAAPNLEDPAIFPDMEDSGLLTIPSDCLKVRQVLGAKLLKTVDSLTPLTPEILSGFSSLEVTDHLKETTPSSPIHDTGRYAVLKVPKKVGDLIHMEDLEENANIEKLEDSLLIETVGTLKVSEVLGQQLLVDVPALTALKTQHFHTSSLSSREGNLLNTLKIHIGEGKDIHIEWPLIGGEAGQISGIPHQEGIPVVDMSSKTQSAPLEEKKIRTLTKKYFSINQVILGEETKIEGQTLFLREKILQEIQHPLVTGMKLEIITPDKYDTYSETIMDVQPIVTKEGDAKLGTGVSRVLDGVVMVVTGTDEDGVQIGEFGSSEGVLEQNILWGRPGAPDKGDILIKTQVTIKRGTNMERPGPLAAHTVSDMITQEIRQALKKVPEEKAVKVESFDQYRRPGKKKIVIIKEIMGQGAMHDNLILPIEPVGILGGKPNVDLGNLPIVLSPLEVLDGGIHALTCIGPASKETSRHYYREPLVLEAMRDLDLDLCGVILIGSPQVNSEKFYVSERLGMLIEALDIKGAVVSTEGFGNNHIDFASHIEQVGMRGMSVVGMSFTAVQGALVVGNKYMTHMVDNNKSEEGIENEVLSCNTLCHEDAVRALAMLKSSMAGETVAEPERKWNPHVKEMNIEVIEKELKKSIPREKTL